MIAWISAMALAAAPAQPHRYHLDTIRLLSWTPSEVTCGADTVKPVRMEIPAAIIQRADEPGDAANPTYHFRIDAYGRALSIHPDDAQVFYGQLVTDDFEPALAGSRFPVAQPKASCTVRYVSHTSPLRDATIDQLLAIPPDAGLSMDEFLEVLRRPEDTCGTAPSPRTVAYPPFDQLPDVAGHLGGALLRYDVDATGATTAVELLGSNGPPELGPMVLQAVKDSRYAPGAKHGCITGFRVPPRETLKPPQAPADDPFLDPKHRCPRNGSRLVHVEDVPFPPPFQRRNIEGWGMIRFDVAPDGSLENLETVRAEPAAEFGEQAKSVLLAGHADPTPTRLIGCIAKIRFALDDNAPLGVTGGKPDNPVGHNQVSQ